jgi:hypothetical protein
MTDAIRIAIFGAIISLLSFAVSATTMYFTWLRRGRLAMTTPMLVFFGFDEVPRRTAKIFLRTLLYSTSAKGKVVEGLFVKLRRGTAEQTFGFWGYSTDKLTHGSGLYVPQTGVVADHHFVQSVHQHMYEFAAGTYAIDVFARLAGKTALRKLAQVEVELTRDQAAALSEGKGVMFELMPEQVQYVGHIRTRPPNREG